MAYKIEREIAPWATLAVPPLQVMTMDEYEVLDAIQKLRHIAVQQLRNEADVHVLTEYGSGYVDGLDQAWLAVFQATRQPLAT